MSTTDASTARPRHSPSPTGSAAARSRAARLGPRRGPALAAGARARGGIQLFEVPFASAMSDSDLGLLAHTLDLTTQMDPKMRPSPNSPGVVRPDHFSGPFLKRRAEQRRWVFEARTWGRPATQIVHEWQLLAADAAHLLAPTATRPERFIARSSETQTPAPGRGANKYLARIRRRLLGL